MLSRLQLPSFSPYLPRKLVDFKKFKANELRTMLLFGHAVFSKTLKPVYFSHFFWQLVVLMHMAESRDVLPNCFSVMQQLADSFVLDFPRLYTSRHCVQMVHSVIDIPATVKDFGPLSSYATFNFEDILGKNHFRRSQVDSSACRNRSLPSCSGTSSGEFRQLPISSTQFRSDPCNRIPARSLPETFRRNSDWIRVGSRRNFSGKDSAGIRSNGNRRNSTDPTESDRNWSELSDGYRLGIRLQGTGRFRPFPTEP